MLSDKYRTKEREKTENFEYEFFTRVWVVFFSSSFILYEFFALFMNDYQKFFSTNMQ